MSRDAVRFGRVPKREKAKILAAMQSSRQKTQESKILTEMNDDSKIIETIVRAHYDTCDYTRNKIEPFIQKAKSNPSYISCSGTTCPMKGSVTDTFHEQFSERFMDHVRQVCTFAKLIPGFKCLHHDDQVTLLKSCVFEVLLVRLAGLFDSQALICLNGDLIRRDTITHMPPGNAKFLMDSVFGLALRMNQFGLSDAEIGLFCAVVIITPDRPGLRNPDLVHKMQSKLKSVLSNILLPQHPEHATMFSELMTMVHDLRTLNTLHTEKFLQQFKFGGGSSSIDAGVIHTNQDGGSSDEGSQGSNDSSPTNQTVGPKRGWMGNEQDSTGNESPQSYTDTTSTGSVEDGSMNRRSPGMGSVSSSESVRSTEILKLTTNDLKVTGSALLNALSAPTSLSSIAIAAAEVAAKNPSLVASTRSPSSATLCPIMSRRREVDPLCSEFSASKNVDSQKIDQQFLINNLKLLPLQPMSDTGSSSTAVAITIKSNTRTPPAMASSSSLSTLLQSEAGGSKYKTQTRKLDSPSDSGIDSPKGAQGSTHSTNTSLCSSPINDEEKTSNSNLLATSKASEEDRRKEDDNSQRSSSSKSAQHLEEHASMHPLLKRALEQPPQPFNPMMRGVTTFQDEVYKPHKKFRRRNLSSSANIDECPSSTQSTDDRLSSPPPSSPQHHTGSLLASQLAEAPKFYEPRLRSPAQEHPMSLLASTLRRETPLSTPEETKRNELLANLILEGNVPSLCPLDQGLSSEHQGLLMCATSRKEAVFSHQLVNKISNTNTSNLYTTSSLSQDHSITENSTCIPRRQLPPPTATITSQSSKSEPTADYRSIAAASGSYCPYSSDALLEASTRHIPVQQAPTKPHHHHSQSVILGVSSSRSSVPASKDTPPHPEELSKLHSLAEAAASLSAVDTTGANDGNSSTSTGIDSQPLNLSTSRSSPSKQNVPTEA